MTTALSRILVLGLLFVALLGLPLASKADALGTLATLLNELDKVHANPLPVSGDDISASVSLFNCLDNAHNDTEVIGCIDAAKDTPLGQKANSVAGTPSWFWDLVNLYVAVRSDDYWGVVGYVGEAGICIVGQVMAGGADVCTLVKELVEAAKEVLDVGKAIGKFFASLGKGAWEAAKEFGCSIGLGGCSSGSPPEQIAYAWIFAPKVRPDALTAIEDVNPNTYPILRKQLEANASHDPVIWSLADLQTFKRPPFAKGVVDTASAIFDKTVNEQWRADVPAKLLPALTGKRAQYDNPQQVALAAADAAAAFKQTKANPSQQVASRCTQDFSKTFGFATVDRWILQFPKEASMGGGVKSNAQWCSGTFWTKNAGNFALHFHGFVKANFCPESAGALVCPTLASYESCFGLMTSVYQGQQCAVNAHGVGSDIAKEIMQYFASQGSKYPCSIDAGPAASTAPAVLRCKRPMQQYHCSKYYAQHYGSKGKVPVSVKVLDCALSKDGSYQAKEDKLWNQAIPALTKLHPALKAFTGQKGIDPLVIGVSSQLFGELDADAKKYGLAKETVLSWETSIDGVDVATLAVNLGSRLAQQTKPVASLGPGFVGVNPPDPAGKESGSLVSQSAAKGATGGGFVPKAGNLAAAGAGQALPAPSTPLSGGAPAGISKGQLAVIAAQVKVEPNCKAPLAAVTVSVKIRNTGGLPAGGGATIHIREIGGTTKLASAGIALPIVKAGETRDLSIPVTTPGSYASLPGMHQLGVYLEPQSEMRSAPYQLPANVPAGHCAQKTTSPATGPTREAH